MFTKETLKSLTIVILLITQIISIIFILLLIPMTNDLRSQVEGYRQDSTRCNLEKTIPRSYFEQELAACEDQVNYYKGQLQSNDQ